MTSDVRWAPLTVADAGLLRVLSPLERARVESLSRPADRGRSMLAAALLRVASAPHLGCRPEEVVVDRTCTECGGPHGAPRIIPTVGRAPHVSVSHSGVLVVVAVSLLGPIGVDVQRVSDLDRPGAAAEWVRREALVKSRASASAENGASSAVRPLEPPLFGYAAALAGPDRALRRLATTHWEGSRPPRTRGADPYAGCMDHTSSDIRADR
jgi:4'-phosphopantetheinyl transferase